MLYLLMFILLLHWALRKLLKFCLSFFIPQNFFIHFLFCIFLLYFLHLHNFDNPTITPGQWFCNTEDLAIERKILQFPLQLSIPSFGVMIFLAENAKFTKLIFCDREENAFWCMLLCVKGEWGAVGGVCVSWSEIPRLPWKSVQSLHYANAR